nr:hypothetical protein [uncultured Cohaesibacter sp.]
MKSDKFLKLKLDAEKVQGLVVTLNILDSYPGDYDRKFKTAYHCLHDCLEVCIQDMAIDLEDIEESPKSA